MVKNNGKSGTIKNGEGSVVFGVFTDLHMDIMHDSLFRLRTFLDAAKRRNVDFIVNLGDFSYPDRDFLNRETNGRFSSCKRDPRAFQCSRDDEKREAIRMLHSCKKPVCHVLGNHDMDICTRDQALKFLGAGRAYYSFDMGHHHFIVLDCNYVRGKDGKFLHFEHCNHYQYSNEDSPFLPPEQLSWLEKDIMASPWPSVIFSHPSLSDTHMGLQNREEVWRMFRRINKDKKRVILCMNGHSHIDGVTLRDRICYANVNSISNMWLGEQYSYIRYSKEIDREYPYIKKTAPYRDPLYAMVTMSEDQVRLEGTRSTFVGPSPYEIGYPISGSEFPTTPFLSDFVLSLKSPDEDFRKENPNTPMHRIS